MNVKLIRMASGEDVIADLHEDLTDIIVISNPIVLVPAGNGQIAFAPWSPALDPDQKEVEVNRRFVVYIAEVNPEILDNYKQMFSKIVTPSSASKKIIT
jgi:hypothetical protein